MTTFPESRIVGSLEDIDFSEIEFPIFTLYDHPADFPDKIVVRLFEGTKGVPTNIVCLFDSLEEARAAIPEHWARMARAPSDDPVIIESYV